MYQCGYIEPCWKCSPGHRGLCRDFLTGRPWPVNVIGMRSHKGFDKSKLAAISAGDDTERVRQRTTNDKIEAVKLPNNLSRHLACDGERGITV